MDNKINTLPDMPPENIPNFASGEKPDGVPDFDPERVVERAMDVAPTPKERAEDVIAPKRGTIEIIDRGLILNQQSQGETNGDGAIDEKAAIEEEKELERELREDKITPSALYENVLKNRTKMQSRGHSALESAKKKEVA